MASTVNVNPHFDKVREESEQWLSSVCGFGPRQSSALHGLDFGFFCAVVIPFADEAKLRLLCDWGNWIFPFDDAFDNGALKDDQVMAQRMIGDLISVMEGSLEEPEEPLLKAFQLTWKQISEAPKGVQKRFAKYMKGFCRANLEQVQREPSGDIADIDELTDMRRGLICTTPIFALIEYASDLDLPDEVVNHPVIEELRVIITDIVWIQNDIVSYFKEQDLDEKHNLVTAYLLQGYPLQAAFEKSGNLLQSRYRDWYRNFAQLPFWEENIDRQIGTGMAKMTK
ncbi:hypothetical protein N7489_011039 [Penicillium chrysogenum]|uniref:Terpene synthase n=1 Tax=Penicillium chrysogenum TaxID=5076 RepID=A0ABQ8WCN3_PENCH|nr:uncharacterized protein N7489_011039 [Penicillium chrysogenum]KAJ5230331.1 hypothetical protein N7489_011039 [Penicillium chrysogenum]KAJ5264175.1 hypothetical protein N7505_008096 [Penicillium chrysogenum]KAJ6163443.1 hypothetical protein N7497_003422 [Penicillium chrysogenum]